MMSTTATDSKESVESVIAPSISKIFHADAGGDIVFESSDGVLFYVHSKNLEFMSEGFPPVDHTIPPKDPVPLTEDSNTLELLFQFTYHRMPPDLKSMDFESLMKLAEAAEKYVIYYARALKFIPEKGSEIIAFASQHDHDELVYEVAPVLVHKPLSEFAYLLPTKFYIPWSLYHDQIHQRQPQSKEFLTEHFRRRVAVLNFPVTCNNGCRAGSSSIYDAHDTEWLDKINKLEKLLLLDDYPSLHRSESIEALIESTLPVAPQYQTECCNNFLQWRKQLREHSWSANRSLRDFVKEYRERTATGKK
ncbi:hypothetical protein D9758_010336 [Tetrapyrgos nigripes]|uniref:BTB domain-containing protein n=1 Tax=Tetrapyrgos nigripes TaxID=182062 RepID=A0A8H5D0I6_9AGAR|nr:hypothetical protein D9758_010336 [Tetrapyrgos nigripes]